jgi:hypothetical protein
MNLTELIRDTAFLGYAIGGVLVLLGLGVGVVVIVAGRRDDGFTPIGLADPSVPARSPFAPKLPPPSGEVRVPIRSD